MSRIGKQPIELPDKVEVAIEGTVLQVKGPKGELTRDIGENVHIKVEGNELLVLRPDDTRHSRSHHGLVRSLVSNMVQGVDQGYKKTLIINGVGYRAEERGNFVRFDLGYSHPIMFELPEGVSCTIERQVRVTLECADNELLGQVAAKIRSLRKPEPYKGKGIRYSDEVIQRKAGKAGA